MLFRSWLECSPCLRENVCTARERSILRSAFSEAIRHHREQTDALLRRREQNFERQRRLITSELYDTVVRDLTHAVMAAQYAKAAHSDDGVPIHEFDAISGRSIAFPGSDIMMVHPHEV